MKERSVDVTYVVDLLVRPIINVKSIIASELHENRALNVAIFEIRTRVVLFVYILIVVRALWGLKWSKEAIKASHEKQFILP